MESKSNKQNVIKLNKLDMERSISLMLTYNFYLIWEI